MLARFAILWPSPSPPALLQVRHHHVDGPDLERVAEAVGQVPVLPAADGGRGLLADAGVGLRELGGHRLLEPHQVEGLHGLRDLVPGLLVEAAVAVDADVHVGADRGPHPGDLRHHPLELGEAHAPVVAVELPRVGRVVDVELDRGEAVLLDVLLRPTAHLLGLEAASRRVAVHPDLVPELAAEKLVDGEPEGLAGEVPQRRLERRHHADVHAALRALEEPAAAHVLLEPVDVERVLADQVLLGDVLHHVVRPVDAVHRLRAAHDALVRLDLDEQAVLAADEAAPHAGDPQLRGVRGARGPLHRGGEGPEGGGEGGRARGAAGEERAASVPGVHGASYQVRSFSSSWICSRATGRLSMWSFSHFEKSFSMSSDHFWSIWPGV